MNQEETPYHLTCKGDQWFIINFHIIVNVLKGTLHFFWEIGWNDGNHFIVKKLSFTVFESIQRISGSGGSTFSLA